MRHRTNRKKPLAEINVVPYIDVMLVLLVIFMVTTPLMTQGVHVNVPKAHAETLSQSNQEPIVISVDKNGFFYLNIADKPNQPISPIILANRIAAEILLAKQANQSRQVLVKGDKAVNYDKVMSAMVLLQQAGASQVGLITEPGVT